MKWRTGWLRFAGALVPVASCALVFASSAQASLDPAASLYRPEAIGVIKLELPPASIKALELDPEGEYQPGTFSYAETGGTPGSIGTFSPPQEASIRLKGSYSFRPLGQKAAFKIKFPKKGTFLGLRKMTLNNMVQDTSMLNELLAYQTFRALGVPASRIGYADVIVNGQDYGVHTNLETLDKVSLEKRFGPFEEPPQHLYEGESGADVVPATANLLEVDEGDEADRSDLEALVAAVNGPSPPDWSDTVTPYANLVEMTRMFAAQKYMGEIDGYSTLNSRSGLPNNYYLYSDPLGQFRILPSGTDENWFLQHIEPFLGSAGVLFNRCVADTSCYGLYKAADRRLLELLPDLELDTAARCVAAMLQPWQAIEPAQMRTATAGEIATRVAAIRTYIPQRAHELATFIGAPAPTLPTGTPCPAYGSREEEAAVAEPPQEEEPEEEGEEPEDPDEEPGPEKPKGEEKPSSPTLSPSSPEFASSPGALLAPASLTLPQRDGPLRLWLTLLRGRTLLTHVDVPEAGGLRLTAKMGVDGDGPTVCVSQTKVRAGSTMVSCRLDVEARRSLSQHARRLALSAVLRTLSGARSDYSRTVTLGGTVGR